MKAEESYRVVYENGKHLVELLVTDEVTGAFRVIERSNFEKNPRLENGYCAHVFLQRVYVVGDIEVVHDVLIVLEQDFSELSRRGQEQFVSAMINYASNELFLSIQNEKELEEFVCDYAQ